MNALKAKEFYRRDVQYIVRDGKALIINEVIFSKLLVFSNLCNSDILIYYIFLNINVAYYVIFFHSIIYNLFSCTVGAIHL